jgi:hypothetical protein
MIDYYFNQPKSKANTAMFVNYKHVGKPGKRSEIGNYPGKADLLVVFVNSKVKGMINGAFHDIETAPTCPVSSIAKKIVDELNI